MKKCFFALFSLALLLGFSSVVSADEAEPVLELSEVELDEIRYSILKDGHVDIDTADYLVQKLRDGRLLDSFILDEKDAVKVESIDTEKGKMVIHRIADGSYKKQTIEDKKTNDLLDSGLITPMSVSGGSCSSGSGWSTCKGVTVKYVNTGVWKLSFQADYTLLAGANNDQIDRVYNKSASGLLVSVSSDSLRIIKSKENANGPAEARYSVIMEIAGISTTTRSVSLIAGANTVRTSY